VADFIQQPSSTQALISIFAKKITILSKQGYLVVGF
jgi:hypothetical protein